MEPKIKLFIILLALSTVCIGIMVYKLRHKSVTPPPYLYKIVTENTYNQSLGKEKLELPDFDKPFIHLATEDQIAKIIKKFFAQEANVRILKLDVKRLPGRLVKEKNPGGETEYYHLYDGFIPHTAIINIELISLSQSKNQRI